MAVIKTEGLILHSKPFFEKDCLLDVFTQDLGRVSVLVKGGLSRKSKPDQALQPLVHAQFVLFRGKSFFFLQSIDTLSFFPQIRESFNGISLASYIVDIVRKTTMLHQAHPLLLQLILDTLNQLSQAEPQSIGEIQNQFHTQFLENEGLLDPGALVTDREFIRKFEEYSGSTLMRPVFLPV